MKELLNLYFAEVRGGNYPLVSRQFSLPENAKAVLDLVQPFLKDTASTVRAKAATVALLAGRNTQDTSLRHKAVDLLVLSCRDMRTGNNGQALDYLATFRKDDFTQRSRDSLRSFFHHHGPYFDKLIRLIGFLELDDMKAAIRPQTQWGNLESIRWAALVSLSRMNDEPAVEEMMRRVKRLPVNDGLIYQICPDLVYTRHPMAIAYLVELLNQDAENCLTADAEREAAIPCGYRIMEQLAPVIEGYPLELDGSGDLKTRDYRAALNVVREWFVKQNGLYVINRDRY